jgi:hypothetical protein
MTDDFHGKGARWPLILKLLLTYFILHELNKLM